MNNKLEAEYIRFVRDLTECRRPNKNTAAGTVLNEVINRAKELYEKLIETGYGK